MKLCQQDSHLLQGSTVIAINAPHGTCVEVPDPNAVHNPDIPLAT
jgi:hypothetical protein